MALGFSITLISRRRDEADVPLPRTFSPPLSLEARTTLVRQHGIALIVLGAALPLGEGVAVGAVTLVLVYLLLRRRELTFPKELLAVGIGLGVWLSAGMVAWAIGGEGVLAPSELRRHLTWLALPIVYVSSRLLPRAHVERAAIAFLVALCASALFGIIQYVFDVDTTQGFAGLLGSISAKHQLSVPGDPTRSSAGGFFMHRLKLADVLVLGIGLLWIRQLTTPMDRYRRGLEVVGLAVLVACLGFTFASASWLGVVAGGLATAYLIPSGRRRFALLAAGLCVAGLLAAPALRARLADSVRSVADSDRVTIWETGIGLLSAHPFGIGIGNSPTLVEAFYEPIANQARLPRTYAHNLVLSTWEETGPVGVAGYLLMWLGLLALALGGQTRAAGAAAYVMFVLAAYFTCGLVHDVLYHPVVSLAFASAVGGALGVASLHVTERS